MIRRFHPLLALALLLAVSSTAVAQQPAPPPPAAASPAAVRSPAAPPADLDAYVTRVRQAFEVPGVAVTVVKSGQVLIARGYGVRELGKPTPVDGRTLFGIAYFVARWDDRELRADAFVTFALNPDGSIDQVKMRAVSSSTDFSFDFHDLLLKPVR